MHHSLLTLRRTTSILLISVAFAAGAAPSPIQDRADRFLALVNAGYKGLYRVSSEAQWKAVTDVTPAHDAASETAGKASAAFNGNPAIINEAKELLKQRAQLNELTVRQLDQVLRNAAEAPMTNPDLVAARVEAETKQASMLNSFEFKLDGKPITANDIEADVYAKNLPANQWNARWWQYVQNLQGVDPPAARGEEFCDAATKTHINDTPAYYHSYAFATVLKFQLHDHIARKLLKQSPQACNYANNKEVGAFLKKIMEKGGTEDWRKVLKDATGEELSTRAMVEYFKPLMTWLEKENKGRQIGWE